MISVVLRRECETFREEVDGQCEKCFALEIIMCPISYVRIYCVHLMKVKYIAKRKPSEQVDKWFAGELETAELPPVSEDSVSLTWR